MAELINLRRIRKRNEKDRLDKQTDLNRARFGRTKRERDRDTADQARGLAHLDQHKLTREDAE